MASIAQGAHLPALGHHQREEVGRQLQATLVELVDLSLIGKQLHWNIFGRPFKPLHEHLDARSRSATHPTPRPRPSATAARSRLSRSERWTPTPRPASSSSGLPT
jgi:hypothetical protein